MLSGARVLVTGANGFLGANLVRTLLDRGADVIAVARPSADCWRLRHVEPRVRILRVDLPELVNLRGLPGLGGLPGLPRVDLVFHLASAGVDQRMQNVSAMIEANVSGTHAVLLLAHRMNVERMVQVGSSGEYGPGSLLGEDHVLAPTVEYGATKAAGTLLAQAFSRRVGLPLVTVRPFSVFGPWEAGYRLIPYCILRALDGHPIEITGGQQTRDFVFVDDVMRGLLAAGTLPEAVGQTFNLSTGISTPVRKMVDLVVQSSAIPATVVATRPHESDEMWMTSGNPERAARVLDWRATTSLAAGVDLTVEWFRRERDANRDAYP